MRPCFRHDNILRKNSGLLEQLPGFYEVSHPVPADFNLRTADDLFDSADKVEAAHRRFQTGNLGVTLFENICKSESLNYHALALPWRLNLRSTIDWYGCFTYDWAHSMLQDGPLNVEVFQYLKVCKNFVYFAEVRDWLLLLWIFLQPTETKAICCGRSFLNGGRTKMASMTNSIALPQSYWAPMLWCACCWK